MEIKVKALDTLAEGAKYFLQKVITPPIEKLGLLLTDNVKLWRFKNQVKILAAAEQHLKKHGVRTRKVALKILTPMLEESSIEEDESLQDKWAALIANTVSEDSKINTTLFTHILSQLTRLEAEVFELIFDECCTYKNSDGGIIIEQNTSNFRALQIKSFAPAINNCDIIIDNLLRLRLIQEVKTYSLTINTITVSALGRDFLLACRYD
ncbi:Abi-alpha family protein [Pedobacter sp. SYSU D00535]|uniref:Abi-alpha family protein n=1 Tax=Pedobacter sp. SYSU D00535 TaxID=2810308 RepID=UPI001A975338|nr:Abi-alpha family protein [Pedobacter sp. SYSU D00535]